MITVKNNNNCIVECKEFKISPFSFVYFDDDAWKSIYSQDKIVRELVAGNFVSIEKTMKSSKKENERNK